MKFIFTADLHIKLNAKNIPKDWQKNRFRMFFEKLNKLAQDEQPGFIVIGGDIFDKMPTIEELGFYFELIKTLVVPTLIYDGNHEATKKGETFLSLLKELTTAVNDKVKIIDDWYEGEKFPINILPYCKLKEYEKKWKAGKWIWKDRAVVCTHVRGNIPPYVKEEVDLNMFSNLKTVFAGDLHNHENTQQNIVYPGAPMSVSFHRNKVKGGVLIADTDGKWNWVEMKLPQLLRKTVDSTEEMVKDPFDHVIYELVGNSVDLANLDTNNELLDKKVVTRHSETTLDLKNLDIKKELVLYLTRVVGLGEDQLQDILRTFDDYIPNPEVF